MKKILLVHHFGGLGGAGVSLLHIVESIDKSKFKVTVACPKIPSGIIDVLEFLDCKIIELDKAPAIFNYYNGGNKRVFGFKGIKNLFQILNDKATKNLIMHSDADIIAVNSMTLCWLGETIRRSKKKAICFHRESYRNAFFSIGNQYIKKSLSKYFDKVAFISKFDSEITGEIEAEKCIIYDKVDIKKFDNYTKKEARSILNLPDEHKYVLYVGGFSELKGAYILVNSLEFINDNNIKVVFLGGNSRINPSKEKLIWKIKCIFHKNVKRRVINIINKKKLTDKIIFFDVTDKPEIFFKACDLVVFPSTLAHQSRPIYEAGISNIPILISDFPNTNEFVVDRETGYTFINKNSKDLANKIVSIVNDNLEIKNILKRNFFQTNKNHDLASLTDELNEIFDFWGDDY